MLTIQYENSVSDFINFSLFHYKNSRSSRRTEYLMLFILPAYLLVFHLLPNLDDKLFVSYFFMWALFTAAYVTLFHYIIRLYLRQRVKYLYSEGKNTTNIGHHNMTLDDDGITDEGPNDLTKISWNGISKISKDDKNIYIYTSALNAFVIPLKSFEEDVKADEIIEYLNSKMKAGDELIVPDKINKQINGFKKFVVFLISGAGVWLLLLPILIYGAKYDLGSAKAIMTIIAFICAFAGSKLLSKYPWSVILVSFLTVIIISIILMGALH